MWQFVKDYWISWLLLAACLVSGSVAALLFQYANPKVYEFIIAAFLQTAGVFLALSLAYFFFEQRSHRRQKNIDEAVARLTQSLRGYAVWGVLRTIESIYDKPLTSGLGPSNIEKAYREARNLALKTHTIVSGSEPNDPLDTERYFGNMLWIFQGLESLAGRLESMRQLVGPALTEYESLSQSMQHLEARIREEGQVWKEFEQREPLRDKRFATWERTEKDFPGRMKRPPDAEALPREALFNLQVLSGLVVHLVDVLDVPGYEGDQEYEERRKFAPEILMRSNEWGAW